jgi:YggT family protein
MITALITDFIFGTIAGIFAFRLWMQLMRVPFSNPFAQAMYKFLAPVLQPLERFIPRYRNLNLACLLILLLTCLFWAFALSWQVQTSTVIVALALLVRLVYWMLFGAMLIYVIGSLLQSGASDQYRIILALVVPLMQPIRRFVPPLGPLDLSPAIFMLLIHILYLLANEALGRIAMIAA